MSAGLQQLIGLTLQLAQVLTMRPSLLRKSSAGFSLAHAVQQIAAMVSQAEHILTGAGGRAGLEAL